MAGTFTGSKHPRGAAGSGQGGQFISAGTLSQSSSSSSGGKKKGKNSKLAKAAQGAQKLLGSLDAATIRRFQASHGLQVDGIIGTQTAQALLGNSDASEEEPGALEPQQIAQLAALVKGSTSRRGSSRRRSRKSHP